MLLCSLEECVGVFSSDFAVSGSHLPPCSALSTAFSPSPPAGLSLSPVTKTREGQSRVRLSSFAGVVVRRLLVLWVASLGSVLIP